jgi:hypothetical protein
MDVILARIRELAAAEMIRVTQHAQVEMDADEVTLDEVLDVSVAGQILENYPEHRRGPCCLLCGRSFRGRFLHIVCTTADPLSPETVRRIEALRHTMALPARTVPLYDFSEEKSA